jgi:ribosomal protein S16
MSAVSWLQNEAMQLPCRRASSSRFSAIAAIVITGGLALWLTPLQQSFVSTTGLRPVVGVSAYRGQAESEESLISRGDQLKGHKFRGASRYKSYDGFEYKRKLVPTMRIRLARWGNSKYPYYRIQATVQRKRSFRSARYFEQVGFWDPMRELDHPKAFGIKADRVVHWLRAGAAPTPAVANILDLVGIVRRTGPFTKRGEWEWRIDKFSGPEEPEGWAWDGPQAVSWGNKPVVRHQKGHPHSISKVNKRPLIERYGFKGYTRIPVDDEVLTEPVTRSTLLQAFGNTQLPMY